jgi:choline-sulfatase
VNDVNKPDIVLVLADQVSAGALDAADAPNLLQLSHSGVVFERAYCASPLCVPSRMALMTGLLPSQTGAIDNAGELPASVPTFAHRLRLRGYRTVLAGKMHFIGPDQLHGFEERPMTDVYPAGFDWVPDWDLADDERLPWYHDLSSVLRAGPVQSTLQLEYDAEVMRHVRDVLASPRDRPLLLVVSFTHPHDPYEVPLEYWERNEGDLPERPDPADDPSTRRLRAMVGADRIPVSEEHVRAARRGYYGAISLVDDYVGEILAAVGDDTVVVFTSDHGDMLGERGLWYKMAPFEGSVRVPLIVRGLGHGRSAQPVSLLEVGRMLELLELPRGGDVPIEYLAEGVHSPQVTLIRGPRKLIRTLGEPDLLYDVVADPHERVHLGEDDELSAAADALWDLEALDGAARASQRARRLVKDALATGRVTRWDHPEGDARYIDTGADFWGTLERARVARGD